jgi:hypothetical protein
VETATGEAAENNDEATMKKLRFKAFLFAAVFCARALFAGDYASDIAIVGEAQARALEQAKGMIEQTENPTMREALQKAIQEMERAELMLTDAKKTPDKLGAAVSAEESAYQGLLKIIPHDYQVSRSRSRGRSGARSGQPRSGQIDQLELTSEEDRYETERQATAAQTPQQKEQLQIADKLKQLAQRQQDLNDRLKELQTALAEARTEQEREDIQRQLKRLSDEERQTLADVDELRQTMDQSPNAASMSKARQQLEQARFDTQRASQELQNESVSQALAAGTRAQQGMQELREEMRNQASSQFAKQMRQMRSEARDLANQEENISTNLEALTNPDQKSLDDSAPRQQLARQMAHQESALTNLLGEMQTVSEQAEASEPLLSEQLYDTLRRASQMYNESLLKTGEQLIDHGLVSQAGEAERDVRKNLNELREKVERAAQSVLGNETDALRYAQKELDDLSAQVEREAAAAATNAAQRAAAGQGAGNTNSTGGNQAGNKPGNGGRQTSSPNPGQGGQSRGSAPDDAAGTASSAAGNQPGNGGQQASSQNPGQGSESQGSSPGQSGEAANSTAGNQPNGEGQQASGQGSGAGEGERGGGNADGGGGAGRLREVARQFGGATGGAGGARGRGGFNGPITGSDFLNWSDRMREVEQVVDSAELRNRLAGVRERVAVYRSDYRRRGQKPDAETLRTQVVDPMNEIRTRLAEDLARLANVKSLVPLDHDPVPENYTEAVRKYYEKLGGGQ